MDVEKLKENVITTGKEIGEKAKDAAETAKLKMDILAKRRELNQLYAALGRVYFAAHQDEEGLPEDVMFRGIHTAEAELAELKADLENHRSDV